MSLLSLALAPVVAVAGDAGRDWWVPNGVVRASALVGTTLYIGGDFTTLSPFSGSLVPIDRVTGSSRASFPRVAGSVHAIVSDGQGGWFIGGQFSSVGGQKRGNLAQVRADFTVSDWSPATTGGWNGSVPGSVLTIVVRGDVVYVGGVFDRINGIERSNLGAVRRGTGELLPWAPSVGGEVHTLLVRDSILYVGGSFDTLAGAAHRCIGAVHAETGAVMPWGPSINGSVYGMVADDSVLFVAGGFMYVNGTPRWGVCALDRDSGALTPWQTEPHFGYQSIALVGDYLYADAHFAFHRVTGQSKSWDARPNGIVYAQVAAGNRMYVAGSFTSIGGESRTGLAEIDLETAQTSAWNPGLNDRVYTLCVGDSIVYAGGRFTGFGHVLRNGLAAIDVVSGRPTSWDPGPLYDSFVGARMVSALAATDTAVYVAGDFHTIGGAARHHVAALDAASGTALSWDLPAAVLDSLIIEVMRIHGSTLYIGGRFRRIGLQWRSNLAAIDLQTATVLPWAPAMEELSAGQAVHAIAVVDTTVYIGGDFYRLGGAFRRNLGSVSLISGAVTSWAPVVDGWRTNALLELDGTLIVGGAFYGLGGGTRHGLAQFDLATGNLTDWDPEVNGSVRVLAHRDGWLYVGGEFTSIAGRPHANLAAIDPISGAPAFWSRDLGGQGEYVTTLALDSSGLYAGGNFLTAGPSLMSYLAATSDASDESTPIAGIQCRAEVSASRVRVLWSGVPLSTRAVVWRHSAATGWRALGGAIVEGGSGRSFEDVEVHGPARYGYRLQSLGSPNRFAGETWVDVPGPHALALVAPSPTRGKTPWMITLQLIDDRPARLEVLDLSGRRILSHVLEGTRPGTQRIGLPRSERIGPGLYFARLVSAAGTVTRRVIVTE